METNRLIDMLAADNASAEAPMMRVWWIAVLVAALAAGTVFFVVLGPRADFIAAASTPRFLFKFVVTLTLSVTAIICAIALAQPGASTRTGFWMLLCAPALLALAIVAEVAAVPPNQLQNRWLGTNALLCLTFIPLIGIGPLAVLLFAMKRGAPTRPALSGAVAGLVAGGLAATFYAAHCFDDSPLFVAFWYSMAVALLGCIGALAGKRLLQW